MSNYLSDDEQVEAIKSWLKTYGPSIIAGIVIGASVILGWQYWTARQSAQAEQASLHYQTLIHEVEQSDLGAAHHESRRLRQEFPNTPYAALAGLVLARVAVEEGDMAAANEHLQWVVNHAELEEIKDIARLRLARVLLAEGRLEEAEVQLDRVGNASLTAQVEELKGDLYVARNEPAKARMAYEAAIAALGPVGQPELLQMKLDNLPPQAASES